MTFLNVLGYAYSNSLFEWSLNVKLAQGSIVRKCSTPGSMLAMRYRRNRLRLG